MGEGDYMFSLGICHIADLTLALQDHLRGLLCLQHFLTRYDFVSSRRYALTDP